LYSADHVRQATGISSRQLQYWIDIGVIAPTNPGTGSGTCRWWSPADIVVVRVVKTLVDHGHQPKTLRNIVKLMRNALPNDETALEHWCQRMFLVWCDGKHALLADWQLPDWVRRNTGKVWWSLSLRCVAEDPWLARRFAESRAALVRLEASLAEKA
jgi:DNA-binding transcriptional MerR regulator